MSRTPGTGLESRQVFFASLLTAVLLLAVQPSVLQAGAEPWEGPAFAAAPAEIARAAAEVPTGAEGVTVLLSETLYVYDAAGRETYTQRLVYKIGSASAHESWSAVEEAWSPWRQETPRLRARVITPDGSEHVLDPATINLATSSENGEPATSADMFEDGRLLRAPLPAIGPGAVVEQEVVVREKIPFFEAGVARYQTLAAMVPVRRARLTLELPAEVPLRWVARRLPEVVQSEETAAGRRRLLFEARDLPPFEEGEPGLPPEIARTPYVGFSTGRSWSELARSYSAIVDKTLAGADLQPFLRTARVPAASQLQTIGLVLARLHQEVRYTGLELGAGGLIPRTPAETLRRKFGDCKDKAVLLTGLLRALDIPAYVALLYATDDDQDVEEALPGFGVFNHAIVVVPGKPAIWIDPTDPYARIGELPIADQGRLALIAAPSTSGLVRTPATLPSDNLEIETREIYLADLGPARVIETSDYLGGSESGLRAYYTAAPADELRESLASYMQSEYQAEGLTKLEHSDPKDLTKPFRIRLEAARGSRGATGLAEATVALFPRDLLRRLPDELVPEEDAEEEVAPPPRQSEYVFAEPFQTELRYRIVPPAGFVPRELPKPLDRQLGPARLSAVYAAGADGTVTATLRFDTGKRRLSAREFNELRAAARKIAGEDAVLVSFEQVGEAHLTAGRVREALAEFERLSAAQPRQALPRTRVARALLAGGLGEAARQEAERAIRLEPDQALVHRTLGWILQHDALGRRFGPGHDRAAAIAAYRKAKQLDPEDSTARAELAILLEHDARGERYSPAADLPAAIEEYRALRKDLETGEMDDNLAVALLWAGRLQELRGLLEELEDTEQRRTLKLVVAAALDGPDTALRLAERWTAAPEPRSTMLRNAAQNLLVLRRYPEAAALIDRASRQSPGAAALLSQAEVLRRTRRHEEMQISLEETPSGPVRRLLQIMAAGATDGKLLTPLLSRRLARGFEESGLSPDEGLALIVSVLRRNVRSKDLPLTSALEIGLAAARDQITGDPAIGYRVRLAGSEGQGPREVTSFVVQENGEYRLLTMALGFEQLGVEALDRLEQGDLRAARQWLDWAHEETVDAPSDDPLPSSPLAALWQRGREAGAEEIRCAASALAVEYEATDPLVRTLLACRDAAGDAARRQAFDLALLNAYEDLGLTREAAEAADRLAAAAPDSTLGFVLKAGSLVQMDRDDDARRLAEERLRTSPNDAEALHVLVSLEGKAGRYDRVEEILRRIADSGQAGSEDLNTLAWMSLVRGQVDDQAITHAQRSANLKGYESYPPLHTLAALYAEVGKTAEAYRIILQALETRSDETPSPDDWYVFGRLAEHYGRPDMARIYYERVQQEPGEVDALSTYGLARRRLAALGKASKAKQAGR